MDEQVNSRPTRDVTISPTEDKGKMARPQQSDVPTGGRRVWARGLWIIPLGWELAVPIAAGAVLGHRLDSRYQSSPVWTLVLLLLGAAAGFYNVWSLIRRAVQRDSYRADPK